ncbi:Nonribosomal peptide synthetase 8 [Colletotrichum tanaceti]|uniref:Nonribosomal peptide synthetase 8 n=1 Tax=Colletotrichum tanaceti TaxID=1306861 RepID=A0A4U6X971_9PEZI|nr:Nonribosomal peptide synthetase 8 [Colletotrichum tanaceti]KAJ0167987.1 Nonribosomal peptide synthetase 8 [Colletotrichum tanaceti]TKW52140.1 Nonribosomal peptide synthetase 8 [Colletotrichum tanaceti]
MLSQPSFVLFVPLTMSSGTGINDTQGAAERLKTLVSKVLAIPLENVDADASFVGLGGDSFKAVHLYQGCADEGLAVRFQDILHKPLMEIASLAAESCLANGPDESSTGGRRRDDEDDGHERYPQMPRNYDVAKIYGELAEKYGLGPEDVETIYPCSPMQESMYIGQKMSSRRLYRTRGLFEAHAALDPSRFEAAWNDVVRRHQTLRTVYVETPGPAASERLLDAVVLKRGMGTVTTRQVDDVADAKRRFAAGDADEDGINGNDTDKSHHRITLYTTTRGTGRTQTLLQVDLNHLTVDGTSLMILMDELVKRLQDGQIAVGPVPAPGYGRYIDHLRNQADEGAALDYWIEYLDGAEPCYFPTMNDNDASGSAGSFAAVDVPLSAGLGLGLERLRAVCRDCNATVSTALQAVWALVLRTYTGDRDVCFGYLSSGRSLPIPGVSEIVGPMMNLLVCRVGGVDGKSLGGLLEGVRDDFVNALPHQCFSIGKVQRILGTNETKLFNTIVTSYYSPSSSFESSSSSTSSADSSCEFFKLVASHNASDFDLVLKVTYSDSDIRVRLAYSTAVLSPSMAQNVAHTFSSILGRLMDAVTEDLDHHRPDETRVSVRDITSSISPRDLEQVTAWNRRNAARAPATRPVPVHALIEDRALRRPGAPAIYAWDGEMTYRELDEAATAVARRVLALGIGGPGVPVALCFEKSMWYSVAMVGVLKSGNAFVPVDISNPTSRREEILRQLGISTSAGLIICSRDQAPSLRGLSRHILELDGETLAQISSAKYYSSSRLPSAVPAQLTDPAYIIFTSGSTGTPKGVVVEHGAYSYAAQAHGPGIRIDAGSRVLQFASYGFDTSMEDHLTTLAVGACLCVPSDGARLSLRDLASFASASRANWAHLTPSFAELLTPALLPTIKTMVLGGEPMTAGNIRTWAASPDHDEYDDTTELIQVYGPSECCVTSTISPAMSPDDGPTNIGSAVPGCGTWIVRPDDPNALQAVGAVGELLVEGPILARGYLDSPEMTGSSFTRGLDWAPEKRLYKTGDLVRYDSSGRLHFVHRRDGGQVKLRGQRIELGEIERQMALDPRVRHGLALVPAGSGPCAGRLTAVIVLDGRFADDDDDAAGSDMSSTSPGSTMELLDTPWLEHIGCVRDRLLDTLPPYMNPELWIILKSMPRNSSGKLDRKTVAGYLEDLTPEEFAAILPRMEEETGDRPGSEAEVGMRRVWSEVLNVPEEEIGWNSSFYYLGGDSISAMTISGMLRQMDLDVSTADILRYRTIERLARASKQLTVTRSKDVQAKAKDNSMTPASASTSTTSPPTPSPTPPTSPPTPSPTTPTDPFDLSPIQQLHFQASPDGDALDQQTMVVKVTRTIGQDELLKGIRSLLRAHPMLRARFERHGDTWTQRTPPDSVDDDAANGCRVRFHNRDEHAYVLECVAEAKRSIHLARGPLVAWDVFETARQTLMSVTIHHLVVDAVSWRILFRELEEFLSKLHGANSAAAAARRETTSFRSWCAAQRQFASALQQPGDVLPPGVLEVPATDLGFWGMNGSDEKRRNMDGSNKEKSRRNNCFGDTVSRTIALDAGLTRSLSRASASSGFGSLDVLVSSVIESFSQTFGRPPCLFTEGHGREPFSPDVDPSGTVGWFTTFSPVVVAAQQQQHRDGGGGVLRGVREAREARLKTPLNGFSYFTSRFLGGGAEAGGAGGAEAFRRGHDRNLPMEVTLNYLGDFQQFERDDSLFNRCDEDLQEALSELRRQQRAGSARYALISLLAVTKDDRLSIQVEWNKQMDHQVQLADWVLRLESTLKRTISHLSCGGPGLELDSPPLSPSDILFPSSVGLEQTQLSKALDLAASRFHLRPADVEAVYPCSPIQDSLMISQLKESTNLYSQHFLFRLSEHAHGHGPGPGHETIGIDPDRLLAAWKHVCASHAILRTIFLEDDESGMFLQVVLRSVDPDAELLRMEDEHEHEHDLAATLWARQQSRPPGPAPLDGGEVLHKLRVYSAQDGSVYCLLDKNHLITDGTTSRLLIRDLLAAYDGRPRQTCPPYSSYIGYIQQQDTETISQYWSSYLEGAPSCHFPRLLQHGGQHSSAAKRRSEFTRVTCTISDKTPLRTACRELDLTPPAVFQAAWAVVLSAYLHSDDVVFGVLGHGRDIPVPGASEMIGPMATIVPLRVRLSQGSGTTSEILRAVQHDSIEHISRQAVSLARIAHAAGRNGGAVFNTIFNFQRAITPEVGNIKSELLYSHDTSEYDIAVCVTEEQGQLRLTLESPTHFMSKAQAERLLASYAAAVRSIISMASSHPETPVRELGLATDLDRIQLEAWNPARPETKHQCIHDAIAETSRRQPRRPAICSWDGDLSYADLDSLSTGLAVRLRSLGAGRGEIVVLCFEKSLWAVVAMLAVAKSGAAFVHIDIRGAPKRTESVVTQTKSRLGLASAAQHAKLASVIETVLIVNKTYVEGLLLPPPSPSPPPPPSPTSHHDPSAASAVVDPSSVLYVIFTSGTTGAPKGVVIQHRSFCSAVAANRSWLQIEARSRVLQFTSYCFDASLEEIFTVLVAGGCVCVPSEADRLSDVAGFVARNRVNWAAFTPSFLRTLDPDDDDDALLGSLDFITVHAEPMGQDLVARWAGKIRMRPSYGPTECSVTSTVGAPFAVDSDAANIGWPVGCRGWVVHPENHDILMPVGAVGELLLDGPIVGQGYLDDEAKTAAAFIDPPAWAVEAGSASLDDNDDGGFPRKLYKTGDLVRYAQDGSLLIQRRKDHSQVKIRGQRVELGEIQYHLDNLSGIIRHSMVLVPQTGPLQGRLVAVASLAAIDTSSESSQPEMAVHGQEGITIVRKEDLDSTLSRKLGSVMDDISSLLGRELPQYMIPETWLLVRRLPVQLSLKLDRQRVVNWVNEIDDMTLRAALDVHQSDVDAGDQQCSPIQETVLKIWKKVLGIQQSHISLDQSFFRLGGDSIYGKNLFPSSLDPPFPTPVTSLRTWADNQLSIPPAMQVMRLCKEAGLRVTTQDVLANPTVRQLASVASLFPDGQISMPTPPLSPDRSSSQSSFASLVLSTEDNVENVVPCSPFQQRMYHAFLESPHKPYLFNSLVSLSNVDSKRPFDVDALQQAWQQTVDRHAILRSAFIFDASSHQLFHKILREHKADVSVHAVRSEADATAQSRLHLGDVRSRLFRDDTPPHSIRLFTAAADDGGQTFVHFVMGHVLIDHVSLAHVLSDFSAFYHHYRGGRTSPEPALNLLPGPPAAAAAGFHQYIRHVRQTRDVEESNRYWVEELRGVDPCLVHRPASDVDAGSDPSAVGSVEFTVETTAELRGFLREVGVTLSSLLQFAWALLLHFETGHASVCFGHLSSDRDTDLPHADDIVGPMLAMMVARAGLGGAAVVLEEALRAFQDDGIRGLRHKTFDLTEVERRLGRGQGLFNTLVNYRKVKYSDDDGGGGGGAAVDFRSVWKQDPHEQILVLAFNEGRSQLEASLTYYESLFSKASVARLSQDYCRILRLLVSGQHRTVGDLRAVLDL